MTETLQIRCRRCGSAPTVAVRVWLPGGLAHEPLPGLALVTGRMLEEGTVSRDWRRIAAEAEALGMDVSAFGAADAIGVSIDALAADWCRAIEWAAQLALEPAFPGERLRWVARQAAAELSSLAEQPEVLTGWAFQEQLYAPHPWSRPLQGDRQSLGALTPADCARFHSESLARGCIVSIAGAVDPDAARAEVERRFQIDSNAAATNQEVRPVGSRSERVVDLPTGDQAHLFIGRLTVPFSHPERVPLELASVVLGSGPGLAGRIPERIRETEGLAYVTHVATAAGAGVTAGRFTMYLATAAVNVPRARAALTEEVERLLQEGISDRDFDDACRFLLGSEPFRRETARQMAVLQALSCLYGLPLDREDWLSRELEAIDRRAVDAAMRKYLDPSGWRTTVGRPR